MHSLVRGQFPSASLLMMRQEGNALPACSLKAGDAKLGSDANTIKVKEIAQHKTGMVETISAKERRTRFNWATKGPSSPRRGHLVLNRESRWHRFHLSRLCR